MNKIHELEFLIYACNNISRCCYLLKYEEKKKFFHFLNQFATIIKYVNFNSSYN